ncbi:MAG: glycosyltransferase [Trueperaceae bacterium]|jgi:glycosyltransferase involved in cell wall biosynthesis|nr:MAG: glycosyltransferase [Trueperaceae bacterium]
MDARGSVVVIIPALDEAGTVATVVRCARNAGVGPVLVVDDGSSDATAQVAARAGAEVLRLATNRGKGGAVVAGAASRDEEVVVLLDADLIGLTAKHVRALAAPVVSGEAVMSRGVFTGGRWSTTTAQRIAPQLNGQRAVERVRLLEIPGLATSRYGVEVAITEHAAEAQWPTVDVELPGVSQVTKEEKRGIVRGTLKRLRMYAEILRQVIFPQRKTPNR